MTKREQDKKRGQGKTLLKMDIQNRVILFSTKNHPEWRELDKGFENTEQMKKAVDDVLEQHKNYELLK